jgi:hypothetical protein
MRPSFVHLIDLRSEVADPYHGDILITSKSLPWTRLRV